MIGLAVVGPWLNTRPVLPGEEDHHQPRVLPVTRGGLHGLAGGGVGDGLLLQAVQVFSSAGANNRQHPETQLLRLRLPCNTYFEGPL